MATSLSLAEAHLERSYSLGKGHRFTLDPYEQETASGSAIIRAHHEYLGIPVRRSREFTSRVHFPGNHDYGSLALAWEPALFVE